MRNKTPYFSHVDAQANVAYPLAYPLPCKFSLFGIRHMPSALTTIEPRLTDSQERFAVHYATFGDPTGAYRHAYDVTTSNIKTQRAAASRLLAHPGVAQRVVTLRNAAAAGDATLSAHRLIRDLEDMVNVDTNDLMQLRVVPCPACWPDDVLAAAVGRALATQTPWPDVGTPRDNCAACAGAGRPVGQLFNTADLPLPARRLFKGIQFYPDGGVKQVLLHDTAALRVELHKLKGMHVDRSVSLNLNADLKPLKRGMSVEEALQIMESIAPTLPAPNLPDVVSEQ